MNDSSSLDLAAMLCSRLCHDMLSPVGAFANGLELLATETDPDMRQNCIELLEQSATISTNKLKFFRLAFDANLAKPAVKVLLNFAQIAVDALVRGGTLMVGAERRDGACEIVVRASGPKIAFDATLGHALDGTLSAQELSSRTAAAHMIYLLGPMRWCWARSCPRARA